ncbi:SGNH/GDSL hydrolase family protein [Actinokineospora fastidiosa]|uniref:SGNH hydrolase n=1 Tax=Actinokineospora fastidiosa TaxID=1816 RepID=A0A918LBV6_9PSEU|nr:SGNH/GDSL hydrolase family protein [Actinokineospora fastidiosa]GGS27527.1 SGNH hydrolase [Actinokineospora fastidiosa]
MSRVSSIVAIVGMAAAAVAASPVAARPGPEPAHHARWVHTWTAMPQLTEPHNLPPAPFTEDGLVMADTTLRQTVHTSIGGRTVRLRFSNAFGGAALPITAVSVAKPAGGQAGVSAIDATTARQVTFHGKPSTVVPVGAQVVSDPFPFPLGAQENLAVSVYLADGQATNEVTSHPGSRTTSHLLRGNHVASPDLPGATPTDHWYLLSGVEVMARASAVAIVGDSLTDGRGSTTNGNNRWPDRLLARLQGHPSTADIAVLNQAAGGNRVLNDGLGPNALARLDRDVLAHSGVRWMIVFEGVNDLGTAAPTEAAQKQVADDLIAAYEQLIVRAHAQDIRVYGATLLPFGGHTGYDDPDGHREAARQRVNDWIRASGRFDAVIDLDRAVRDPRNPRALLPAYDDGDHLHLNPTGYQAVADAVPARLFR